jgi:hypothetical protein
MKQIMDKAAIEQDAGLSVVKAFRIANKRCGEFKRAAQAAQTAQDQEAYTTAVNGYQENCGKLQLLANKARELGFKIWVNTNGQTGHTYDKDYKPTADDLNNWDLYQANMAEERNAFIARMNVVMAQSSQPTDEASPDNGDVSGANGAWNEEDDRNQ